MQDFIAERLKQLPPYLFVQIDQKKRQAIAQGKDIINLGVGDPDLPTPKFIIDRMAQAINDPANHRYPFELGVPEFRQQAANWMKIRFALDLDPQKNIITLIGTKEGIAHLPLAVVNPGDVVLVPQPGYPVYQSASMFAGADIHHMPLLEKNNYLPDLQAIPIQIRQRAKLMYLNYPNNPTSAVATEDFYRQAVKFAKEHQIVIAQDAAYIETYFDQRPISILNIPGALDIAIEFHSLSKTFNMTGWRIGLAVGNAQLVAALGKVKQNVDSGQFNAIQWAGCEALAHADHVQIKAMLDIYRQRRDALVEGLTSAGLKVASPSATFYLWGQCPPGIDSMTFAGKLLDQAGVVVIPGVGFGQAGEGYFRAALTVDLKRIKQATERIKDARFW